MEKNNFKVKDKNHDAAYKKKWRGANKPKIREYQKKYRAELREEHRFYMQKYRAQKKNKMNEMDIIKQAMDQSNELSSQTFNEMFMNEPPSNELIIQQQALELDHQTFNIMVGDLFTNEPLPDGTQNSSQTIELDQKINELKTDLSFLADNNFLLPMSDGSMNSEPSFKRLGRLV